jgi:hypothetical protein
MTLDPLPRKTKIALNVSLFVAAVALAGLIYALTI